MHPEPIQVLQAARRPVAGPAALPRLVVAGATGVLGNEVLRRLVGLQRFGLAQVLAREPITTGLRGVRAHCVEGDKPAAWPPLPAEIGVILFDPPRLFHDRERALWTPQPAQLLEVAGWMHRGGVSTIAVVLPHAQGRLPEALKRGLASLDEHAVAALGFDRLLFIRSAQKPGDMAAASWPERVANSMLSIGRLMVPSSEQPVRAVKVAELVAAALELAPPGIHVAAPELVWQAAQGDVQEVAARWLGLQAA
ncbi:MAG: hypothetical protein EOO25_10995 [Comamonadaceae bacterium]|nr:MAG: hypothetical protein EOO25_10995 [Comamonadaceae bacterium]